MSFWTVGTNRCTQRKPEHPEYIGRARRESNSTKKGSTANPGIEPGVLITFLTCAETAKNHIRCKTNCTHSTTRLERLAKAWSGMFLMRLSASVSACRFPWCCRGTTGTSVRLLSSSHKCLSCCKPWKLSSGTAVMWFASRRLETDRSKSNQHPIYIQQHSRNITRPDWKHGKHFNFIFLEK